jgi:hypothetical protein
MMFESRARRPGVWINGYVPTRYCSILRRYIHWLMGRNRTGLVDAMKAQQQRTWVLYSDWWDLRRGMKTCVEVPPWLPLDIYRGDLVNLGKRIVAVYREKTPANPIPTQ